LSTGAGSEFPFEQEANRQIIVSETTLFNSVILVISFFKVRG
jgi:hypothetical protein